MEQTMESVKVRWPLTTAPFEVQKVALARGQKYEGFGYFLEMGLGKTAVVLAEYLNLRAAGKVDMLVVICPNSIKQNWVREAEKMGAGIESHIWPKLGTVTELEIPMVAMNYEAVITKNGYSALSLLLTVHRCMLVLDESTQIKNPQAKRTKTLIALGKFAKVRRILSGAPVTQGPQDLWAQLRFLGALNDVNYYAYRNHYCIMGGWQGKQIIGTRNEHELADYVSKWGYRARKDQWLDLPPKVYENRYITHTEAQRKHYKEMARDMATLVNGQQVDVTAVITQMMKLQQIGSGFVIDTTGKPQDLPGTNPKLEVVQEIMDQTVGKVIIFVWYTHSITRLKQMLGVQATIIQGGMTQNELNLSIKRFNNDASCRVLLAQVQSAKYGLTLLGGDEPGDRCTTTIFYENSFSLDARIQAEDRNHRIGQKGTVTYIDLIGSEIDELAVAALQTKKSVAQAIIDRMRKK